MTDSFKGSIDSYKSNLMLSGFCAYFGGLTATTAKTATNSSVEKNKNFTINGKIKKKKRIINCKFDAVLAVNAVSSNFTPRIAQKPTATKSISSCQELS